MVWLLPVAKTGRIVVIGMITYVVGLGQSSHAIAGSVEAIYTVAAVHTLGGNSRAATSPPPCSAAAPAARGWWRL